MPVVVFVSVTVQCQWCTCYEKT